MARGQCAGGYRLGAFRLVPTPALPLFNGWDKVSADVVCLAKA